MFAVPVVGILAADPREIRTRALRSPLERPVVYAFGRKRVVTVALDLVAQRPDHLRMAVVAAFAHIDVAAGQLERRIGPHTRDLLDGALQVEQRRNLDEAADGDDDQDADQQDDGVLLEDACFDQSDMLSSLRWSKREPAGRRTNVARAIVFQMLTTISSAPARNRPPPSARMM